MLAFIVCAVGLPVMSSQYRAKVGGELESLRSQSADVNAAIDGLHIQRDRLTHILEQYSLRPDHAEWLGGIADTTPDGTYLQQLSLDGARVEVTGYSNNAASYLTLLTEQSAYSNVQARSTLPEISAQGWSVSQDWDFVSLAEE